MIYVWVGGLVGALLVGWVAGMWTFKRSERWCPVHGVTLACSACRKATIDASAGCSGRLVSAGRSRAS